MARGSKTNFVVDALQTFRLDRLRRYSAAWYGVPHDPEAFAKTVANKEPKSGDVAMMLASEEAALFYRAWWPLLAWVNEKKRLVPSFPTPTPDHPLPVNIAHPIRSALWADDRLREQYLEQRGSSLAKAERDLIASWRYRKSGRFIIFKHLHSHSIFMSDEVFAVAGLYSPIAELVPTVPAFVEAVLLPFADRIVIDGILSSPGVELVFGAGMRRAFAQQYSSARAKAQVRTSLLPSPTRPAPPVRASVGHGKVAKSRPRSVIGTWQITRTELWDREALDLVEPAFIRFEADQLGELGMIALRADVDYRVESEDLRPRVEFSFAGDDDGTPCSGRGWAALGDDDVLRGRIYIHRGDDSAFEAERRDVGPRSRARRRRSCK